MLNSMSINRKIDKQITVYSYNQYSIIENELLTDAKIWMNLRLVVVFR